MLVYLAVVGAWYRHRTDRTIFLASALLKHCFWMKLAAVTRASSLSCVSAATARSRVSSGGFTAHFLWGQEQELWNDF